jgi:hypothetical protein
MNPNRYTEIATQAGERYVEILHTFRSLLFSAQAQPFTNARANRLRSTALDIGRSFLVGEKDHIYSALRETAQQTVRSAQTDVSVSPVSELPQNFEAFLEQSESFLATELATQLTRDAESLVRRYREFAVEADVAARTRGVNMRAAVAAVGMSASDRLKFQFRDRGGRLYASQKFIRTIWRQTLVAVGAEFYLLEAADRGATKIEIVHPDPHSAWHGYEIDLTDTASFLDIRDEAFHPQSNAILKATI